MACDVEKAGKADLKACCRHGAWDCRRLGFRTVESGRRMEGVEERKTPLGMERVKARRENMLAMGMGMGLGMMSSWSKCRCRCEESSWEILA
jgi:hypothetical protein